MYQYIRDGGPRDRCIVGGYIHISVMVNVIINENDNIDILKLYKGRRHNSISVAPDFHIVSQKAIT